MSDDFPITVYHNPACGSSRDVLALIREAGHAPTVIEYLKTGWARSVIEDLLRNMNARPRDILREKGSPAAELGLLDVNVADDVVIEAMLIHPLLVNRPIVVTPKGAKLCRPSKIVLSLLV